MARIHTNLSRISLSVKMERSYALWLVLRTIQASYTHTELLEFLQTHFKQQKKTLDYWIQQMLKHGFLRLERGRYFIVGKEGIFEKYLRESPGKVKVVENDILLVSSIAEIRAVLFGATLQDGQTISRNTLRELTGKARQTQLKYDNINKQPKRQTFLVNGDGEVKPMPNQYGQAEQYQNASKKTGKYGFWKHNGIKANGEGFKQVRCDVWIAVPSTGMVTSKKTFFSSEDEATRAYVKRKERGTTLPCFYQSKPGIWKEAVL